MKGHRAKIGCEPRSILIVLPTWVGDFVMATPFLRAVRDRFADARITFLMEPNLRDLIRGGNWMDECVEWPMASRGLLPFTRSVKGQSERSTDRQENHCSPRSGDDPSRRWFGPRRFPPLFSPRSLMSREYRDLVRTLRRRRFDWAILLPNSFRSALIAWQARAKRRIGYNRDGRGFLLTDRVAVTNHRSRHSEGGTATRDNRAGGAGGGSEEYCTRTVRVTNIPLPPEYRGRYTPLPLVEYYADLAEAVGCDRPGDRLELFTTPQDDRAVEQRLTALGVVDHHPLVVLSPGAKYGAAKCWPADRFATVADRLVETENATVVITCGPGEETIARRIGESMTRAATVFDQPRLTLGELKSLIKRCDLLIANDAGPRHFAKAFGVPVVTVFGPTHPDWTATNYEAERIVRIDLPCSPCQQRICPLGHGRCMTGVEPEMVHGPAAELLSGSRVVAASFDA